MNSLSKFIASKKGFVLLIASIIATYTTVVMAGWFAGITTIVQINPTFAPMQFNSALGLLLLAASLIATESKYPKIGGALALLSSIWGAICLLQWLPGIAIPLDHLFVKSTLVNSQSPVAGRPAPVTAFLLITLGSAFLGHAYENLKRGRNRLLLGFSAFTGLTAFVLLLSGITHMGVVYEWTQFNQMAIQTAVCFTMLSVAGLACAGANLLPKKSIFWLSGSAILGLSAGTLVWLQAELAQQEGQMKITTYERADGIKFHTESLVGQDALALRRLANRMSYGFESHKIDWSRDVAAYTNDCPEIEAIESVDSATKQTWSSSKNPEWASTQWSKLAASRKRLALTKATTTASLSCTKIIDMGKSGAGFVIYAPIVTEGHVIGMVSGYFSIEKLMHTLSGRTLKRYRIEAVDTGRSFFASGIPNPSSSAPVSELPITQFGSTWTLRVTPNPDTLSKWVSPLPNLIAIGGIVTSLLLGYLILLAHKARLATTREKEARGFLESLSAKSMSLTYIFDLKEKRMTYCNQYGAELIGLKQADLAENGNAILQRLVHPDDLPKSRAHFARFRDIKDGEILEFEQRLMVANGTWRWILHRESVHTRDSDGSPRTVLGVGHDITQNHLAQDALRLSNDVLMKVVDDASIGMALVSTTGAWLRVNQSLCDLVGYSQEELAKLNFQTITHPEDLDKDEAYVGEMLEGTRRTYQMEKRYVRKDGKIVWILLSVSLVRDQDHYPLYFISQILDISERKAATTQLQDYAVVLENQREELLTLNTKLENIAITDALTGAFNRRHFDSELTNHFNIARRYRAPLSIILLDVDHFKKVNDTYGHGAGDAVLRQVAKLLKQAARDSDVVARYGGEEFAVICPHTDLASAAFVAERLRDSISKATFECGSITASFGVAGVGLSDIDVRGFLLSVDEALYESKRNGRNRVSIAAVNSEQAA